MKRLVYIALILISIGCKENNCVQTTDIAFEDINESNLDYYKYEFDSLFISLPNAVTPNADGVNDEFQIITNIVDSNFVVADFKIKNGCDEIIHKENMSFPFTFPEIDGAEDGQYHFDFSIVLMDNSLLTGGGILRVVRQ